MALKKAIVLLSGGIDSAVVFALARKRGFEIHALSVDYGQRHVVELAAARMLARIMVASSHAVVSVGLGAICDCALTNATAPMPDGPVIIPGRNALLLSLAVSYAQRIGSRDIFVGFNAADTDYPDCSQEFCRAFEDTANAGIGTTVDDRFTIHVPLEMFNKPTIIRRGLELGVDFALTTSCYNPAECGYACGVCLACRLRLEGFAKVGVPDPAPYVARSKNDAEALPGWQSPAGSHRRRNTCERNSWK